MYIRATRELNIYRAANIDAARTVFSNRDTISYCTVPWQNRRWRLLDDSLADDRNGSNTTFPPDCQPDCSQLRMLGADKIKRLLWQFRDQSVTVPRSMGAFNPVMGIIMHHGRRMILSNCFLLRISIILTPYDSKSMVIPKIMPALLMNQCS